MAGAELSQAGFHPGSLEFAGLDLASVERALGLYLPLLAAMMARLLAGRQPRMFAACLLSVLWTAPTLVALQALNQVAGWWSFTPGSAASLRGMPLELWFGWLLLWGALPQWLLPHAGIVRTATAMAALDLLLMPLCPAAIPLGPRWLLGETAAIVLVLLPALCLGEWTRSDTHLRLRAAMQAATAGLVFLYLVPEIAFALRPGQGWTPMHKLAGGRLAFEALLLLAVPGLSAVQEFAVRGGGTPIPYDPPRRLVTSGVYRYLANPMQLSCSCVLLAWAALLQDSWLLVPAAFAVVYSAGIARWDERQDLRDRFGADWIAYRAEVADWRPRWRPFHAGRPARVYIARGCEPCSRVRRWLERRHPTGLEIVEAETLPAGSIRRMRYDPADGSAPVEGIRAMARAMEHLHLGWAFCGALARLPGIWQMLQLVLDAGGLGPREISCTSGPGAGAPTRPRRAEESS